MGRNKMYSDEELKEKARERAKKWYLENQDRVKQYREENRERINKARKEWREKNIIYLKKYDLKRSKTPIGRAANLVNAYNNMDKAANRDKGDLTAKWVVENIFSKPCAHCGKTGWQTIGCNRINNDKPHTKDNVEPCCFECNNRLAAECASKMVFQYTIEGELLKIWNSTCECGRNGFHQGNIVSCCNNKYLREGNNKYKGYRWSYTPL